MNVEANPQQAGITYSTFLSLRVMLSAIGNINIVEPQKDRIAQMPIEEWPDEIPKLLHDSGLIRFGSLSLESYLEEIRTTEKCKNSQGITKVLEIVQHPVFADIFATSGKTPSNFQQAVAVYIVANLELFSRVVWELPTGCGKSFIIAMLALIALRGGDT